ncbi:MAG TPA: hypothetical protein VK083_13925 [Nocardia sp.]|uniref:hypothetical protein n=1 Tax=Nocardia sp. TaxID=1821 RepID=UPI002B4B6F46|nr:hypothetical protein [Nocardia sp.]HLS77877.1 hypothetical protein [Nocardia sp.]
MKISALILTTTAAVISVMTLMPCPAAHASFPWGACGIDSPEDKVVTTFGAWKLLCGNKDYGYRHIQAGHMSEWEGLAAIEGRNWRDIADMAIAKAHDAPDWHGPQSGGRYCHTGQIYLVNRVTGAIATTVQPTVIVSEGGIVITAFPGGGCRGKA